MLNRAHRVAAGVAVAVMLAGLATQAFAGAEATSINGRIDLWAMRGELSKAVKDNFKAATTIDREFPESYKELLRQVIEMKISHMAKGLRKGLEQEVRLEATIDEVRTAWRQEILRDQEQAPSAQFRREMAAILGPVCLDLITGYVTPGGAPDEPVRATALLILVGIPGSPPGKVDALLALLRGKDTTQGTLFMVVRELGRSKIAVAVPDLVKLLKHPNQVLQGAAATALGRIADADALEPLVELLLVTGDSLEVDATAASDTLRVAIDAIVSIATANTLDDRVRGQAVAGLMRRVLTDPDRVVVVTAANAVAKLTGYPQAFNDREPEELLQGKIDRLREWWLEQPGARESYRQFFHIERVAN